MRASELAWQVAVKQDLSFQAFGSFVPEVLSGPTLDCEEEA